MDKYGYFDDFDQVAAYAWKFDRPMILIKAPGGWLPAFWSEYFDHHDWPAGSLVLRRV